MPMRVTPGSSRFPAASPASGVPLSYAQEQVWLHAQLAPEVPLYNEPVTIHYSGPLKCRGPRTGLQRNPAAPRSVADPLHGCRQPAHAGGGAECLVSLPVIDLRPIPQEQREAAALTIATTTREFPSISAQVPLFRVRLIRLDDEEHRLYLTLSHIIFDGVAIYRVFLPELAALYKAYAAGNLLPCRNSLFSIPTMPAGSGAH